MNRKTARAIAIQSVNKEILRIEELIRERASIGETSLHFDNSERTWLLHRKKKNYNPIPRPTVLEYFSDLGFIVNTRYSTWIGW
jgi:hypothetical protein